MNCRSNSCSAVAITRHTSMHVAVPVPVPIAAATATSKHIHTAVAAAAPAVGVGAHLQCPGYVRGLPVPGMYAACIVEARPLPEWHTVWYIKAAAHCCCWMWLWLGWLMSLCSFWWQAGVEVRVAVVDKIMQSLLNVHAPACKTADANTTATEYALKIVNERCLQAARMATTQAGGQEQSAFFQADSREEGTHMRTVMQPPSTEEQV